MLSMTKKELQAEVKRLSDLLGLYRGEIIKEHDSPSSRSVWKAIENMTSRISGMKERWRKDESNS